VPKQSLNARFVQQRIIRKKWQKFILQNQEVDLQVEVDL